MLFNKILKVKWSVLYSYQPTALLLNTEDPADRRQSRRKTPSRRKTASRRKTPSRQKTPRRRKTPIWRNTFSRRRLRADGRRPPDGRHQADRRLPLPETKFDLVAGTPRRDTVFGPNVFQTSQTKCSTSLPHLPPSFPVFAPSDLTFPTWGGILEPA